MIILLIICFATSCIGACTGIGGGVLIKPIVDAMGIMSVETTSFLSGITVLAMTTVSMIRNRKMLLSPSSGDSRMQIGKTALLGVGAAGGGMIGKYIFSTVQAASSSPSLVKAAQTAILLILTVGVLIHTVNKSRTRSFCVTNPLVLVAAGFALGGVSAFLGIGGGPFNLTVLYLLFSMDSKTASINSLFVIFISQITGTLFSIATGDVPEFDTLAMLYMVAGGVLGGLAGSFVLKRLDSKAVGKLFLAILFVIIVICIYNLVNCLA